MDVIKNMFEAQKVAQEKYKRHVSTALLTLADAMDDSNPTLQMEARRDVWKRVREDVEAITAELGEFRDSFPWKAWRPTEAQPFDIQNAKVEIIDMLHFLINICLFLNITPEDLVNGFFNKNAVNHNRRESGDLNRDPKDASHI